MNCACASRKHFSLPFAHRFTDHLGRVWLVSGDHGAIREGLEAMGSNLGTARSRGNTGRKNLGMDCL